MEGIPGEVVDEGTTRELVQDKMSTEQLLRDKIAHPAAYRQRTTFIPPRGDSPRGSQSSNPPGAQRMRPRMSNGGFWGSQNPFGEMEDSDDIILAKAINEVFGVRGEPHFSYRGDLDIDAEDRMPAPFFIPPSQQYPGDPL